MALQQFAAGREKADTAKTPVGTPVVEIEIRDVVIQTGGEILPDEGFNCLSSVTVNAIPVSETDNETGGVTLTIGA